MEYGSSGECKPHAVCMPSPAQGHINSMLQLAKLLYSRGCFRITFVHTESNYNRILTTSGPDSLRGLPDFEFRAIIPIDQAIASSCSDDAPVNGPNLSSLCESIRNSMAGPFRQLLMRLDAEAESGGIPKVTCVISDTFSSFTLDVASEMGIPDVSFCSVSACAFMGFFSYKELIERGIVPLKSENDLSNGYLNTPIDWIPGMNNIRLKDLPSFVRTTDPSESVFNFCKDESQDARKATAFIINTLDDLESPVLDAMSSLLPPVYAIGPLNLMCRELHNNKSLATVESNLWKEDYNCLGWLARKEPKSVVYANFGSLTVMTSQQLIEFAWGLANSEYDFLWVMRPNIVTDESAGLPEEFLSETSKRGLITSWCPQEEVLAHPSVGGFLTHCGWNSSMESISGGVPMICWPYFGDQQTNCRYLCNEWGIGVEIQGNVKREMVEKMIRELMGGEKGMEMRKMSMKWKESAVKATEPGGKSFLNLERVIKDVLLQHKE